MSSLKYIESQVAALQEPELRQFRSWFEDLDAQCLGYAIAADINSGKLVLWQQKPLPSMAQVHANRCYPP